MNGTRLPENWSPDASLKIWARGRRPDLDIDEQVECFLDYWLAKSGKDATKLDWNRTFRNWIRNARTPTMIRPENVGRVRELARSMSVTPSPQRDEPRRLSPEKRSENLSRLSDLLTTLGVGTK